ncbi:cell division protein ZapE [Brachybacterium sp. DNPG3]
MTEALADRRPEPTLERLLADLVPPPRFARARLDNYVPDPQHPSQQEAKERIARFAEGLDRPTGGWLSRLRRKTATAQGIYLDGGFGVGKTHLLTSLFHAVEGKRVYGTFVECTDLVGALGFQRAVDLLGESVLVCIDEFELDDPGDTLLMTRLIRELSDRGVAVAATSNTLPEALGEGRFAAQDFLREIQSMSERFDVLRIDGEDYRRRDGVTEIAALDVGTVGRHAEEQPGATLDGFEELLAHLSAVHPSRYGALIDDVAAAHITGLRTIAHHHDALRFVVLVDRLYDREVPVLLSAADGRAVVEELFTEELLRSGYRKKYYRALSRLASLAHDGAAMLSVDAA